MVDITEISAIVAAAGVLIGVVLARATLLPCSTSNYSYLYFNYTHSTKQVIIIPEFTSFLILPLFFIATLLAVKIYRRKTKISGVM